MEWSEKASHQIEISRVTSSCHSRSGTESLKHTNKKIWSFWQRKHLIRYNASMVTHIQYRKIHNYVSGAEKRKDARKLVWSTLWRLCIQSPLKQCIKCQCLDFTSKYTKLKEYSCAPYNKYIFRFISKNLCRLCCDRFDSICLILLEKSSPQTSSGHDCAQGNSL